MKILVINGSPKGKRSNSLKLTNAFVKGICNKTEELHQVTEKENNTGIFGKTDNTVINDINSTTTVEQLDASMLNIAGCKGCFACWKSTPGKCCINDDMSMVIKKLLWADVIIYSFPLYYFNVPGTLKNLIDRQLPMVLPFMSTREDGIGSGSHDARYDMSGKKYVLISTCGFYSAEGNYDSVCKMFDHICGKDNYETIFCGQGELFSVKELSARTDEYLKIVEQAGEEFASGNIIEDWSGQLPTNTGDERDGSKGSSEEKFGRISNKTKSKLKELLYPREIFEKMADASWGVSKESGQEEEESLTFTRQMAALYNKNSFDGKDRVLEICYTDLNKTYQIALTKDGSQVYTDGSLKYTTRIDTPWDVWLAIAQNEIRGDVALAEQKYRVSGDFSLMMKWDTFFGTATESENPDGSSSRENTGYDEIHMNDKSGCKTGSCSGKNNKGNRLSKKPPVMTTMLIAWITFWIAVGIDMQVGAFISLAVCACLPLIMNRHQLAIYDKLSMAIVSLLSILVLTTQQGGLATNIGYLVFGLLWLGSCLTKEPLCACYVKYDYNGEDALKNPIFMKTNYILALGWGILYIAIAVWTWFLSKTAFNDYLIILNNVMTILMGIFTGWFQNWYPAWVARGPL